MAFQLIKERTSLNPLKVQTWVLRVVAFFLLLFAIGYWSQVVGLGDQALRFDVAPNHWRVASVALLVLQPVAALGLWGASRWGVTVWLMTIAIEFAMFAIYPSLFGERPTLLMFHAVCAVFYLGALLYQWLDNQARLKQDQA